MSRSVGWVWAIGGIVVVAAVGAVGLMLGSASLTAPANVYFSTVDYGPDAPEAIDPDEDAYYNEVATRGSELYSAALPFMEVACAGPFVLLTVLAARRDARPSIRKGAAAPVSQAEATAAAS